MKKGLLLICCGAALLSNAQFDLNQLNKAWDTAESSEFNLLFQKQKGKTSECPFPFNKSIEAPDGLELELAPFLEIDGLENRCMQRIHHNNCERHENIMNLGDLYLPLIEQHLKKANLDADLAFLPMVLTGYNNSYNQGHGQAGLWALSYVDAAKKGLKIDSNIDERLGADPSTKAAVALLKEYHSEFNGDYLMTIAAFAKGSRWTKARTRAEITSDAEMSELFCCLKICIRLNKNFERKNQLGSWLNYLNNYDVVGSLDTLSVEAIVQVLDLNPNEFSALNPVLVGSVLPAKYRTVPLLLPKGKVDEFNSKQEEIKNYIEKKPEPVAAKVPPGNENYYTVKSGDVLGLIAEKLNVRLSQLKAWNNLRGDRIDIGQKLVYFSSDNQKPATIKKEAQVLSTEWVSYTVKPGESLWLIAKKFKGVSAENIMEWNSIDNNIQPGQVLKIYNQ
ncbi:MAG: LysM peptidoglycan-binding domain-containing protein [Flavobacteriales bacterium]